MVQLGFELSGMKPISIEKLMNHSTGNAAEEVK